MPYRPNVFISYARADGADEAEQLYHNLKKQEIDAWRDIQNLDPYTDFSVEIEEAIERSTHVVVCVTQDVRRADSFVRREVAFALALKKPIIPLVFEGGIPPITIINHTWILFHDWDKGLADLLERLKDPDVREVTPGTRREMELKYLQGIGQKYDHWRDLYTDMAAIARKEERKVKPKAAALRYLEMQHDLHPEINHSPEAEKGKVITVESFDELREGLREYKRVALIGDPGAGKTTTLERLAYELATEAAEKEDAPLPLFVRLGAYDGADFRAFLESNFGGLRLADYIPKRIFLLLDGLNETPSEHVVKIKTWVESNPDITLIVTCRKLDYVDLGLRLKRIDVSPLDVSRIHLFMGNYLEAEDREILFWSLSGTETRDSWEWLRQERPDTKFSTFWFGDEELPGYEWEPERRHLITIRQALRESSKLPGMLGVVSNPFLLFLTIDTFILVGETPSNRGQLFDSFVHQLFEKRGKPAATIKSPWIAEDIQRKTLSTLAYRIQADDMGTTVDMDWARKVIEEHLMGSPLPMGKMSNVREIADHLLYLAARATIIERGEQVYFVHQLLQEYFAAFKVKEDIQRGVSASQYFPNDEWWLQTGWEETVLLLAGMEGDASQLVEWLTPVQPTLAYRCATESGATCPEEILLSLYAPAIPPIPAYMNGSEVDSWRKSLPRIAPLARMEWGKRLSKSGDRRRGVGLHSDSLPDIDWCEVPYGDFIFGGDTEAFGAKEQQVLALPTFYISRYPVTYSQFQCFVDDIEGHNKIKWFDGLAAEEIDYHIWEQDFKYDNHPCEAVNWYQAIAFCRWLSWRLETRISSVFPGISIREAYNPMDPLTWLIRLPTEQEWEKAARGTDGRPYAWGESYIPGFANVDETEKGDGPYWLRSPTAVGMYPQSASPYGALDMSGNTWEWTLTEYNSGESNRLNNNNNRVLRGGSWFYNARGTRVAYRRSRKPDIRVDDYGSSGFRLCTSYPPINYL